MPHKHDGLSSNPQNPLTILVVTPVLKLVLEMRAEDEDDSLKAFQIKSAAAARIQALREGQTSHASRGEKRPPAQLRNQKSQDHTRPGRNDGLDHCSVCSQEQDAN